MQQRSDRTEIIQRGIVREEYLDDDPNRAQSKIKQARLSIEERMNTAFANRPTKQDLISRGITHDEVKIDYDDELKLNLESSQKRNYNRRLSLEMDRFLANRPSMQELEDAEDTDTEPEDEIDRYAGMANSLRGAAAALQGKLSEQKPRQELIDRNIIKRPLISRSLQANAEALENAFKKRKLKGQLMRQTQMQEINKMTADIAKMAKSHTRMDSAVKEFCTKLPFEDETNVKYAQAMMNWINVHANDVDLKTDEKDNSNNDEDKPSESTPLISIEPKEEVYTYPFTADLKTFYKLIHRQQMRISWRKRSRKHGRNQCWQHYYFKH